MTIAAPSATRRLTSDRRLQLAILILCIVGIGDAAYLTYVHYSGTKALCSFGGGCETVQTSHWASLGGVPVPLFGLIGYVAILMSLAIRHDLARAGAFGLALVGFGFSLYLTYREIFTIKAICQWCVASAAVMTALTVLTAIRLMRDDSLSGLGAGTGISAGS